MRASVVRIGYESDCSVAPGVILPIQIMVGGDIQNFMEDLQDSLKNSGILK
ncbi:hypothetical protein GFS31_25440 [Leptolyngbya sp. BL0902]|nr:hypothetical protein GFS31_25440 [Leptolyngbya sp. BL0902]